MGKPLAKSGDSIVNEEDTHIVEVATPSGPDPTPMPFPFYGELEEDSLSANVRVNGMRAATVGSTARNFPPHVPPPAGPFQEQPSNRGSVKQGSTTVRINEKGAARMGDICETCSDIPGPTIPVVEGIPGVPNVYVGD